MATNVTLPGSGGSTVTIPFTSSQVAALAQAAGANMDQLSTVTVGGLPFYTVEDYTGSVTAPVIEGQLNFLGASALSAGLLPSGFTGIVDGATAAVLALNQTAQATTVISGTGGLVYGNISSNNRVFLAGGLNLVAEFLGGSSQIYVDSKGTSYTSGSLTGVEALAGSSTVTAMAGADVVVYAGTGSNMVSVGGAAGTSNYIAVSNAATVAGTTTAVTVNATAGTVNFAAAGAPALINPGAANIVIFSDGSGTDTLNAGSGTDTVFSGPSGVFHAGSAGGSILQSSTVAGSTTLFGGTGGNDQLVAFASRTSLVAGTGGDLMFANPVASISAVTFDAATVAGAVDTIIGSAGGADTINLFSGNVSATAYGANEVYSYTSGATSAADTITGFSNSSDTFKLIGTTVKNVAFASGKSTVTLNDGTTLNFLNVNVSNFKFT